MEQNITSEEWRKDLYKYRNVGLDPYMIPFLERLVEKALQDQQQTFRETLEGLKEDTNYIPITERGIGAWKAEKTFNEKIDTALSQLDQSNPTT